MPSIISAAYITVFASLGLNSPRHRDHEARSQCRDCVWELSRGNPLAGTRKRSSPRRVHDGACPHHRPWPGTQAHDLEALAPPKASSCPEITTQGAALFKWCLNNFWNSEALIGKLVFLTSPAKKQQALGHSLPPSPFLLLLSWDHCSQPPAHGQTYQMACPTRSVCLPHLTCPHHHCRNGKRLFSNVAVNVLHHL